MKDLVFAYSVYWLHAHIGHVMFYEHDNKLQGFTTNKKNLLIEISLIFVILFTGGDDIK